VDPRQIKSFIDAMAASDLDEMEVSHDGWTLRLVRRAPGEAAGTARRPVAPEAVAPEVIAPPPPAAMEMPGEIRAPMFGVVHLQQAPGEPPFVRVGDVIEAGRMICSIEAMKVFNEVRADHGGRVTAVLVTSGTEVEAGQPLVAIERVRDV
jgi:acetyl-CoA carboxylase biotin carboxyl carrier protein